jgi:coenzyme F420-0:L-glutamate ligase/coenzyme F420-1:gamma-L-glutamate ligase
MSPSKLELLAIEDLPIVKPGDDLARLASDGLAGSGLRLASGDVLVVAQKVVSKAEGRMVVLADVTPSARARELAREVDKDPRLVELILSETKRIVRSGPNVLIVEHRLGFVMANAGVDQSNVGAQDGIERALLLPRDPDASAEALRVALSARFDARIGVIINDSFGRAWRLGTVGVALGVAGLPALKDLRGRPDLLGRPLRVSISAFADEIAASASLLMGQGDEGRPMIIVRGLTWHEAASGAGALLRPSEEDLFR